MRLSKFFSHAFFWMTAAYIVFYLGLPAGAADEENCLMCHRYRFLGRINKDGKRLNYNVDERTYFKSLHRNVPCRDCHTSITKIPHEPVTKEVSCANQCHIKPPFANQYFSHEKIVQIYNGSVHAIKTQDPPELKNAQPYCKFCHLNPVYTKVEEKRIDFKKTLRRCLNCHQKKGVTQAYMHVTHRLRKKTSRSPQQIVQLCAKCHQDKDLMKNLDVPKEVLLAVETYNQSIHGKLVALGSAQAADCISCHASSALHDIYKKENPKATINKNNLMAACSQCHKQTNSWFVQIAVHPRIESEKDPIIYVASIFFRLVLYGTLFSFVGLMLLETYGRRTDGIKFLLKGGTTWRGKPKRKRKH